MRITESHLRRIIRSLLREQVVGYKAPPKTYDDPLGDDDHSFSQPTGGSAGGSEAVTGKTGSDDDDGGYLSVGDMGVNTSLHDSEDETQVSSMQVKKLTQQRQHSLDTGDSVGASDAGKQLAMARKMRG